MVGRGGPVFTRDAAGLVGVSSGTFLRAMSRERGRGNDMRVDVALWPDLRTPLWDPVRLLAWDASRQRGPGRPRKQNAGGGRG